MMANGAICASGAYINDPIETTCPADDLGRDAKPAKIAMLTIETRL